MDNLLNALEKLELQIKSSALSIEEVDRYVLDKKRKRNVLRTEYFIKERGGSSRNSEEERLLKFLNQKEEMANELKIFAECFNGLDVMKRELLYYSLLKEESDIILMERLDYSQTSVTRLKREATIQIMDTLMLIEVEKWNILEN